MVGGLEETTLVEEDINAGNFLGNSLLASVLDKKDKETLYIRVQEYMQKEEKRRGYKLTIRQGLTSFFMDDVILADLNIRPYLEKLRLRDNRRVLVNCSCDNETVQHVQKPQLESSYRDHRYFMILDEHREVTEDEANIDFDINYFQDWRILFRGAYDASVCPKGYNCSRAEVNLVKFFKLLDKIPIISEQEWMESVHGVCPCSD